MPEQKLLKVLLLIGPDTPISDSIKRLYSKEGYLIVGPGTEEIPIEHALDNIKKEYQINSATRFDIHVHGEHRTEEVNDDIVSSHHIQLQKNQEATKDVLETIQKFAGQDNPIEVHLHSCYAGLAARDAATSLTRGSVLLCHGSHTEAIWNMGVESTLCAQISKRQKEFDDTPNQKLGKLDYNRIIRDLQSGGAQNIFIGIGNRSDNKVEESARETTYANGIIEMDEVVAHRAEYFDRLKHLVYYKFAWANFSRAVFDKFSNFKDNENIVMDSEFSAAHITDDETKNYLKGRLTYLMAKNNLQKKHNIAGYKKVQDHVLDVINANPSLSEINENSRNNLSCYAVHADHIAVLERLLQLNKDGANILDHDGFRSIDYAARDGHIEALKTIIKHNEKVVMNPHESGLTPLQIALVNSHDECAQIISEKLNELSESAKKTAKNVRRTMEHRISPKEKDDSGSNSSEARVTRERSNSGSHNNGGMCNIM